MVTTAATVILESGLAQEDLPYDNNVCGNAADGNWKPDNGGNNIKAIGYILVQWNKNTRTLRGQIQLQ